MPLQYPGPNEAGLAYERMTTVKRPRTSGDWRGPFLPCVCCKHPDTMKSLLKSSGKRVHIMGSQFLGEMLNLGFLCAHVLIAIPLANFLTPMPLA